ncbi:MAG: hypothetical protein DHS20C05_21680 [Hyphococcus sp.]|nr:MAG: hypothetical protein DHS20C05_21680 [Marinicaulis sp.]
MQASNSKGSTLFDDPTTTLVPTCETAEDLVILEKNPLDDIANTLTISQIVQTGRFIERDKLSLN